MFFKPEENHKHYDGSNTSVVYFSAPNEFNEKVDCLKSKKFSATLFNFRKRKPCAVTSVEICPSKELVGKSSRHLSAKL